VNLYMEGVIGVPKKLSKLGLQMAVFPMVDSNKNRAKNNTDILEMLALKIPVVASKVEPFKDLPVLYAESNYEWYETITKLIEDKVLRKEMGLRGLEHVKKSHDMKKKVSKLRKWLENLPRKEY